jgi:putative chitinase
MRTIDAAFLQHVMSGAGRMAYVYADHLQEACGQYEIQTPCRLSAFLGQLAEESGQLRFVRELWGPTPQQMRYERVFDAPWARDDPQNRVAFSLGNNEAGDGFKYLGRGLIQITGRYNYGETSAALLGDRQTLLANPEQLEQPRLACLSAARFWKTRGCNELADAGDYERITRRINGGLTHYDRRVFYRGKAEEALA